MPNPLGAITLSLPKYKILKHEKVNLPLTSNFNRVGVVFARLVLWVNLPNTLSYHYQQDEL